MEKTTISLVSTGIGLFLGLFLPWVKLEIEKRQQRYNYRKELVATWKKELDSAKLNSREELSDFGNSSAYSSLRSHMKQDVIKKFEAQNTIYGAGGRGNNVYKQMLLDEVARLEKEWRLS